MAGWLGPLSVVTNTKTHKVQSTKQSTTHLIKIMKLFSLILLSIPLISVTVDAVTDESMKIISALKGRTYFAPRESISASTTASVNAAKSVSSSSSTALAPRKSVRVMRPLKYISSSSETESESESESSVSVSENESASESESVSVSESSVLDSVSESESDSIADSESIDSESTDSSSVSSTADSCSSSSSLSESPICRLSRRPPRSPLTRFDYQRPWCPGQVMASLTIRALDPIYDWRNPLTCAQFASNFGGVSVVVGELDGPVFCQAGPNDVTSQYTIVRSLSINQPIYARAVKDDVDFAVAAGPIFYPQGLVYYISVAKEVSKLPQVCN